MNSGLPFNITSNTDLNRDGFGSDRPLGVERNSMYLPARYNVDVRYSRFVPIRGAIKAEIIGEFKNLFNTVQTSAVNSALRVLPNGELASGVVIPSDADGFPATSGYEQRQFQLGFKVRF